MSNNDFPTAVKNFFEQHPEAVSSQQRTDDWRLARMGRFTGSEIHKLMTTQRGGKGFGKTAISYIYAKQAERNVPAYILRNSNTRELYYERVNGGSKATRYGTEWEADARISFERWAKTKTYDCSFVYYGDNMGASPDALVCEDGKLGVLEIKCPFDPAIFRLYVNEIKDGDTLKSVRPEYWWQMQMEMLCVGADYGYFFAYDAMQTPFKHIVKVTTDTAAQVMIKERVKEALKYG